MCTIDILLRAYAAQLRLSGANVCSFTASQFCEISFLVCEISEAAYFVNSSIRMHYCNESFIHVGCGIA